MKVTQATIAKALGLSPSTVGLVTGSCQSKATKKLKSETVERIRAKALELGYRSDRAAQTMRRGRSNLLGVVHSSGMAQTAVERAFHLGQMLHRGGYQLMVAEGLWYQGNVQEVIDQMLSARVEGVLFSGPPQLHDLESSLKALQQAQIPAVTICPNLFPLPSVMADISQGMRDLTRHLLALGHRRLILYVKARPATKDREQGFREALAEMGIPEGESVTLADLPKAAARWKKSALWGHVVYYEGTTGPFDLFEPGELGMRALLDAGILPDALLCTNDYWAFGASTVCLKAGIQVPSQLAITGFDDTSFAMQGAVGITSVRQPVEEMCQKASDMLFSLVRGEVLPPDSLKLVLPCRIVIRESCGACVVRDVTAPLGKKRVKRPL